MALDFPDAPTNGQVYNGFMWDSASSTWRVRGSVENPAGIASTTGSPTITTDGTATVYTFTGDGSITVDVAGVVNALVVGGGGAGGATNTNARAAGGGGAGGHLYAVDYYLSAATHTVTVGAGATTYISKGEDSILGSLVAMGGGVGAGNTVTRASSGGSGGGSMEIDVAFQGLGVNSQGFQGAPGNGTTNGGGGGGAGEPGNTDGMTSGGDGVSNSITGSAVTRAGGGGGYPSGVGGDGGGGNGGNPGGTGTANTGGGGGGAALDVGGTGGSGVVIIRVGG